MNQTNAEPNKYLIEPEREILKRHVIAFVLHIGLWWVGVDNHIVMLALPIMCVAGVLFHLKLLRKGPKSVSLNTVLICIYTVPLMIVNRWTSHHWERIIAACVLCVVLAAGLDHIVRVVKQRRL